MMVRRLSRAVLMAGLVVAVSGLLFLLPGSPASAVTTTNACVNSAGLTDFSQADVDMTATPPAAVELGAPFQLTNINQSVALPGAIFVAGYNLGLLQVGQNSVPGTIATTIEGTNTVQGTQNTSTENISVTFTITDPDGVPGSGDETGTDAVIQVTYDDMNWTVGSTFPAIEFREDTVTPQSTTVAGLRITATIGGSLTVRFGCNPGVVVPGPPETIQLTDPAASFASVVGGPTTTIPSTTEPTTTVPTSTTEPTTTVPTSTTEPTSTTPTTPTTTPPTTTTTAPTTTGPTTPTTPTTTPPTTTTAPPPTTTTTPLLVDASLDVIINGPTSSTKTSKSLVANVVNEGTSTITVCDTNITWDIEVNAVNAGSVSEPANCKTLGPGASTRFKATWTYGAGEVTTGAVVNSMATVTVAGDVNAANNTDSEIRTAK
jgi:hypothetical protein